MSIPPETVAQMRHNARDRLHRVPEPDYREANRTIRLCDAVDAARDERDKAEATIQRVRDLHQRRSPGPPYDDFCAHCGADWPCLTITAVEGPTPESAEPTPETGAKKSTSPCPQENQE